MRGKGHCFDNTVIENFFGLLKNDCYIGKKFNSTNQSKTKLNKNLDYLQQRKNQGKTEGLAACYSQTTSPMGLLDTNF
ncbi:IS3 family transposase [Anaerotignum sp.]|uniref:IS3 family transposase n=1 Tax=Anaerotignum sp. TaxID=2039241 RepID=UPI003321997C